MPATKYLAQTIATAFRLQGNADVFLQAGFQKGKNPEQGGFPSSISAYENAIGRQIRNIHVLQGLEIFYTQSFNIHEQTPFLRP